MIYGNEKLERRDCKFMFDEVDKIAKCNENIDFIMGNHRDKNNTFVKNLIEFEKNKIIRKALQDILEIKEKVYRDTGVKL